MLYPLEHWNITDDNDFSLISSTLEGDLLRVKELLEIGANPDVNDGENGATALYWACLNARLDMAQNCWSPMVPM